MKVAVSLCAEVPPLVAARVLARPRLADYLELTKPRVAVLVLFTVAAGVLLAGGRDLSLRVLLHAVLGTALVAAGASALNQWFERHSDGRMRRTRTRPLPSGRLQALEVLVFGSVLGVAGVVYLALALGHPRAALVAALTFASYVGIYTPLKARTSLNTLVGAVPGALPPLIGWFAVRRDLNLEAGTLFLVLFLWQVPHFLAIAWIHRDDYARAGLRMLPVLDPDGRRTGRQMIAYCLLLLPASFLPFVIGSAGPVYLAGAVVLGVGFLASALGFRRAHSVGQARRVLRASLIYLPGLFALLLMDRAVFSLLMPR